jgi:hypothetical protein
MDRRIYFVAAKKNTCPVYKDRQTDRQAKRHSSRTNLMPLLDRSATKGLIRFVHTQMARSTFVKVERDSSVTSNWHLIWLICWNVSVRSEGSHALQQRKLSVGTTESSSFPQKKNRIQFQRHPFSPFFSLASPPRLSFPFTRLSLELLFLPRY